jgi:hypothetical protein
MDSSKLKLILIFFVAMFVALYLGVSAATEQAQTILWVTGGITLTICLLLGNRIWLLLPLMGSLMLNLRLPGGPTSLLLAQFLTLLFCVPLFLMRKLPYRQRFSEIDFWIVLLAIMVLQVYLRNPTSVSIFGGDTVGGKAYFIFAISLVTYLLLAGLSVQEKDLKLIYKLGIIGGILNFILFTVGYYFPSVGMWYGAVYGAREESQSTAVDAKAAGRLPFLTEPAKFLSLWVGSNISPLKALLHPLWGLLLLCSLSFAAASGYRNMIIAVAMSLFVSLLYRGGFIQIIISAFVMMLALVLLAGVNLMLPLPPNAQRALSFLPGTWEQRYVIESDASTDWRTEIWKEVLFTDRWIKNKTVGDGLGYSREELNLQMSLMLGKSHIGTGISGFDSHRESILASGDYHSGPVQTIRVIGYIGLVVLLLAMIRLAVHAHRMIQRCRNTEWFPLALFIGIPLIWAPAFFVFVIGTFQQASITFFMGAGFLRMLGNNLPLPGIQKPAPTAGVPIGRLQAIR